MLRSCIARRWHGSCIGIVFRCCTRHKLRDLQIHGAIDVLLGSSQSYIMFGIGGSFVHGRNGF